MPIDKLLVIIFSIAGTAFIYWFFLMKKEKAVMVEKEQSSFFANAQNYSIDIKVEGGYQPEVISVPVGKTTKLNFFRTDPSTCLEDVVLGDFNIRQALPLKQKVTVEITPEKTGTFDFSCGMGMFHGKLVVE